MSTGIIEKKISQLPKEKQKEVNDFVDFLLVQSKKPKKESKEVAPPPMFGALKGMFVMADDFDEPLEDFKDYM